MKTIILSINSKWVKLIKEGKKKYEFRSLKYKNIRMGDKILICETKSKHIFKRIPDDEIDWYPYECVKCDKQFTTKNNSSCVSKLIGEFIVSEVLINSESIADVNGNYNYVNLETKQLPSKEVYKLTYHPGNLGQDLAFEISDLRFYDKYVELISLGFNKAPQFYYIVKELLNNE